jgi:tRNA1Val (adenine37-N6)-methyltransferase
MKTDSGRANVTDAKNVARHEVFGGIGDFCEAAKRLLKYGGTFAVVYRPDRLCDLIAEMRRCSIEPKRMTFVHANAASEPSMVLIEGRLGGKCGLFTTPPLLIYKDGKNSEYSDDMKYIMEMGSFPSGFAKR